MPTRVVMVNGHTFDVDMDVNRAASEVLGSPDARVLIEPIGALSAYLRPEHIAYVEAVGEGPMVSRG